MVTWNFSSCQQTEETCRALRRASLSGYLQGPAGAVLAVNPKTRHNQTMFGTCSLCRAAAATRAWHMGPDHCLCSSNMVHKAAFIFNSYHQSILLKQWIMNFLLAKVTGHLNLKPIQNNTRKLLPKESLILQVISILLKDLTFFSSLYILM